MPEPRSLTDPRTMRALAHPVRIRLMEQLTLRGPLTATEGSALIGESPSSCSFHLRTLARYGFIEEAGRGSGRARPWRVVAIGNRWDNNPDTPAATRAAGEALGAVVRERDRQVLEDFLAHADEFETEWAPAVMHANYGSWLTPDELEKIATTVNALWQPYLDRLTDPAGRPPGSRLVHMFAHAFPRADGLDDPPARVQEAGNDG